MTKTILGNSFHLAITLPKTKFYESLWTSASWKSYQCLFGKGCSTVQNISSFEEVEFRNIVFNGHSYYAYSHNDYCYYSGPEWVKKPKTFSLDLIPSTTTSTTTTTTPSTTPSTAPRTTPRTCTEDSTESDFLKVLDYHPVARFSDGEWISGMGNFKFFLSIRSGGVFFLHYGWFLQNLEKGFIGTN